MAAVPEPADETPESAPAKAVIGIAALAALTSIGPVSFQMFLPALPSIQSEFGSRPGTVQLALSLSMLAIAFGTLGCGPLSDRFGRRPTLLVGIATLIAGSLVCAAATDIGLLIIGRLIQAAGAASGMVVVRAIVVDIHGRRRAPEVMGKVMTAMMAAVVIATPTGGLLTDYLGWRFNFIALAFCGIAMLSYVLLRIPETYGGTTGRWRPLAGFGQMIRIPAFRGYAFQSGFLMAAYVGFVTAAPYYFVKTLGIGSTGFGLYTMAVTSGFMGGSLGASYLSRRIGLDRIVVIGTALALAASIAAVGLAVGGAWTAWALIGPATLLGVANGLSLPTAQAGAVALVPTLAGTASGLAGFIGTLLGAASTQIAGLLQNGTPYPIVGVMAVCSGCAVLAVRAVRGREAVPSKPGA